MNRVLSLIKMIFLLVGLALLGVAAWFYLDTAKFIRGSQEAEGMVVELETHGSSGERYYHPVVEFTTPEGERVRFVSSFGSRPPAYDVGESVTVLYPEGSPREAKIKSFWSLWLGTVIAGGLGVLFFVIGLVMAVVFGAGRRHRRLVQTGVPVEAVFREVEQNPYIQVNRRHPWRVVMAWTDPATGESHTFRSENLWQDPSDRLDPTLVRVFIERGNPRKYYVDLSQALVRQDGNRNGR